MKKESGFNLIELMITLVIISILASIAIPSYQSSVMKSNRSEGMTAMLDIMRAQEDYFANNFVYTTDLDDLGMSDPVVTDSTRYSINAVVCNAVDTLKACVKLKGTAQNGQQTDGHLELDSRGNRSRNGVAGWTK